MRSWRSWMVVFALVAVVTSAGVTMCGIAADHRDGPLFPNTAVNGRFDINDVYIFQSPTNTNNTVIAVTISPFTGVLTPATFDVENTLDIKVDTTGDAKEDFTFRVTFGEPDEAGVQEVLVREQKRGRLVARGNTGQNLAVRGGGLFRADNFDDPFAFDAGAFSMFLNNPTTFTFPRPVGMAKNFFANSNLLGVVLEIPSEKLNDRDTNVAVFARVIRDGKQMDRMGFPAINTGLIPPVPRGSNFPNAGPELRTLFNTATRPRKDREQFGPSLVGVLQNFFGRTQADAQGIANFLLPDLLPFDTSNPAGFPNGRRLRDDVIDVVLNLVTNGAVTTDNVGDDNGTRITDGNMGTTAAFPYFGLPNNPPGGTNP